MEKTDLAKMTLLFERYFESLSVKLHSQQAGKCRLKKRFLYRLMFSLVFILILKISRILSFLAQRDNENYLHLTTPRRKRRGFPLHRDELKPQQAI
ncbi:MAG: hypothetical protein LBI71_09495 [Enterobacteriaceae bacterium]|nr:hypothetical protein [Enterobacteriaceae bacterium]